VANEMYFVFRILSSSRNACAARCRFVIVQERERERGGETSAHNVIDLESP